MVDMATLSISEFGWVSKRVLSIQRRNRNLRKKTRGKTYKGKEKEDYRERRVWEKIGSHLLESGRHMYNVKYLEAALWK